jgi:NHLM bacteriocin system ABC transporter ATP-binding protein
MQGEVDLFAQATTAEGVPMGARRPLFRVGAGGVLVSLSPSTTTVQDTAHVIITGVCGQNTRLLRQNRDRIDDVHLDSWLIAVSAAAAGGAVDESIPVAHPGIGPTLNEGDCLRGPVDGVIWLRVERGGVRWCGAGPELDSSSLPIPLTSAAWVRATGFVTVQIVGAEAVQSSERWPAIDQFHRSTLERIGELLAADAQRDAAKIAARARQSAQQMAHFFSRLAALVAPVSAPPADVHDLTDPLLAAFATAAGALGCQARSPVGRPSTDDSFGAVVEMARLSGLRVRRVQLRGDWWRRDVGALVARNAATGRPLAVIPESVGHCLAVDAETGARRRIDAQMAADITPAAVMLYPTLPAGWLSPRRLVSFGLRQGGADLIRLLAGGVIAGLLSLAAPVITRVIIDSVIPAAVLGQLGFCILGLATVALASAGFQLMQGIALLRLESRFDTVLQAAIIDRLLCLPTAFFRRHTDGDLTDRALPLPAIRRALAGRILRVLTSLFGMANFILMFSYDASLAWIAVGFALLRLGVVIRATAVRLKLESRLADMQGQVQGFIVQLIIGIGKLKVALATTRALGVWSELFARQKALSFQSQRGANRQTVTDATLAMITTLAIFAFVPLPPRGGTPGPDTGRFIAFLVAFGISSAALANLAAALSESLAAIPPWRRVLPLLSEPLEVGSGCEEPGPLSGAIELDQVTFRYVEGGPTILDQVSFAVAAGESVAIVGPSGSGKSTLFRLLLGFEKAESGCIFFDGKPMDRLNVAAVRQQFGTVLQQNNMLWRSIYDTICGGTGLPLEHAWEAARLAGLADDIRAMPMGMHTVLTGSISTLSGGQQQRLMIARALVRRPRILLFDEATSALDNETQAAVSASLNTLKVTRILIAHRLSTVRSADRIVVLVSGRVVQQGKFATLAAQPGPFAELIQRQLR